MKSLKETNGADRVARWRKNNPDKNRTRRNKDNENKRDKRKINKSNGKDSESKLICSRKGCNKKGEVHHAGSKRLVLCRDHHNKTHKARGDGPGSAGGHHESLIDLRNLISEMLLRETSDQIPGGLAKGKIPSDYDQKSLNQGVKVELEHTTDREIAQEIAMDHLEEDPDYYEKLSNIDKHN